MANVADDRTTSARAPRPPTNDGAGARLRPALGALLALGYAAASAQTPASSAMPTGKQLEADLQGLPWPQFRSVIEAIPKMKADVDAYGPLGWQFVRANYTRYAWRKNIDRLDGVQRHQLMALIAKAKDALK